LLSLPFTVEFCLNIEDHSRVLQGDYDRHPRLPLGVRTLYRINRQPVCYGVTALQHRILDTEQSTVCCTSNISGESWIGTHYSIQSPYSSSELSTFHSCITHNEQIFPTMVATFSAVTLCCVVLLATVQAFSPTNVAARCSVRGSTIVMDGKTRDLRDRIKSIKNTRRITEAMRLVAAARVRRAQEAVLKTRPLISQLQMVFHHFNSSQTIT
jgi:hypothetical protein